MSDCQAGILADGAPMARYVRFDLAAGCSTSHGFCSSISGTISKW